MLRIASPTMGILDTSRGRYAQIIEADRELLGPLFDGLLQSVSLSPKCDVLFIYCALAEDGRVNGSELSLQEIVTASGASIAVVASDNSGVSYASALEGAVISVNMVMTIDRRGDSFGKFFTQLFSLMRQGKAMTSAWRRIAPRRAGQEADGPSTVFVAATGDVTFLPRRPMETANAGLITTVRSWLLRLAGRHG